MVARERYAENLGLGGAIHHGDSLDADPWHAAESRAAREAHARRPY